ncbi:MAG: uroporphyrinogen-III C-methyltransferase, partial [Candidatus Omnitrophica bacterium]|nr:uroporphyrinogen-III C-methyltransferase [Candidatus Omnitrophota bacterium]
METLKVGSRGSRLALVQVEEVKTLLEGAGIKVKFDGRTFQTGGDTDKSTPLDQANVADNFFTDAVDQALLNKDIDIAIHSAKDLPQELPHGISILALTRAVDETDAFVGRASFKDLPKGAKVGTSSTLRKKEVAALNPDVELVNIRGTIEERIAMVDDGTCDGVIIATVALKRLGLEGRITDIMPWPAAPLQGQLAITGRSLDYHLRKIFAPIDCRLNYGDVTLVGAGPGDPDLITVKGIKALQDADIVLYDYLAHPSLIQHAPQAKCVSVGKRKGKHSLPQAELSKMILDHVRQGKNVVRLKGGDPFIFGRGAEELSYLKSFHVQVNVIPGVSSATGIPSTLGMPLTARDVSSSVAFVSGHGKDEHDNQPQSIKIPDTDTIVFLMGLTKLEAIVQALLDTGRDKTMPVAVISNGTRDDQQMVIAPLTSIVEKVKAENIHQPAL